MLIYPKTPKTDYDLRIFDVDDSRSELKEKRKQERKNRFRDPNTSPSKKGNWFLMTLLIACIAAGAAIFISGKVELSEINAQNSDVMFRLEKAAQENDRLKSQLSSMVTPAKIEEYALDSGLRKEQFSQTTHISVNTEKIVEVAQSQEEDFFGKINNIFDDIRNFLMQND